METPPSKTPVASFRMAFPPAQIACAVRCRWLALWVHKFFIGEKKTRTVNMPRTATREKSKDDIEKRVKLAKM